MKSGQICSLELGRRQPSLRTLRRVCAALGTTPDDLLRIAMRGESPPQNMTDGAGETEALLPGLRELFETPEDKLFAPLSRRGILRTTRQDSYAAPLPSEDTVSEIERRITDYLRENWKDDRKRREKLQPSESLLTRGWQMVTTQKWDEITKSWVITTLKAPAGVLTNEMLEKMGLPLPVSSQAGAQTQQGGQQQAMPKK